MGSRVPPRADTILRAVLTVSHLTVHRGPCPVVDDLSLTVATGEIVALVGPNGAGKSTALKGMLGLLPATGEVVVDGVPVGGLGPRERARRLGYVPQRTMLSEAMEVRNVVAQGRFAHHGLLSRLTATDVQAVDAALAATDALVLVERPFTQLSLGEQQRVLLARAIASGAGTILLDEPTAALDVGHAVDLLALLRALAAQGHGLVLVLHDLDQVARCADRVVVLDRGRTVAVGSPTEVLGGAPLSTVFGVAAIAGGAWGFRRP